MYMCMFFNWCLAGSAIDLCENRILKFRKVLLRENVKQEQHGEVKRESVGRKKSITIEKKKIYENMKTHVT